MIFRRLLIAGMLWLAAGSALAQSPSLVDDTAYTPNLTRFAPIGGEVDDSGTDTVGEGNGGAARITPQRGWHVNLRNNSGSEIGITASPLVVRIGDGTDLATVLNLAGEDPLAVAIVDGAGAQITSFGGGTQYAEDTAHSSGDQLTMAGVVQQSADGALSSDGDRSVLQVDSNGFLKVNIKSLPTVNTVLRTPNGDSAMDETNDAVRVNIIAGAGSGGTAAADGSSFTIDTTNVTVAGCIEATDTLAAGTLGGMKCGPDRELDVDLASEKVEDTAHTTGDLGQFVLGVMNTSVSIVGDNGDYAPISLQSRGQVIVTTYDSNGAELFNTQAGDIEGAIAHDAAIGTTKPMTIAGRAQATEPTDVSADGDVARLWLLRSGLLPTTIRDGAGDSAMDDANDALRVNIVAGAGSGGTAATDDSAFTAASGSGTPMMGFVTTDDVDSGDVGVVGMTDDRALWTTLVDGEGDSAMSDASNSVNIVGQGGFIAASQTGTWTVRISDGTDTADVFDLTNSNPQAVAIVDGNGDQVTSFGGGTEYTVNAAAPADPTGGTFVMERDDALSALTEVEGDWTNPRSNANGALWVAGDGTFVVGDGGATISIDDGGGVVTVDGTVNIGTFPDNEPFNLAQIAGATVLTGGGTETGALRVTIANNSTGVLSVDDNGGSLTVDGTVAVSGTVTVDLGANNDVIQPTASNFNAEVQGDAATDAAVSGNPVYVGSRANLDEPTAVSADGDVVPPWLDRFGRTVVVAGHSDPEAPVSVTATSSGNTTVIAAGGASTALCIQKGSLHNGDSANVVASLQDGAGGTTRWSAELAAEGGGSLFDFGDRGWCLSTNTLLNVNLGGAGSVRVNVTAYYIMPQ